MHILNAASTSEFFPNKKQHFSSVLAEYQTNFAQKSDLQVLIKGPKKIECYDDY